MSTGWEALVTININAPGFELNVFGACLVLAQAAPFPLPCRQLELNEADSSIFIPVPGLWGIGRSASGLYADIDSGSFTGEIPEHGRVHAACALLPAEHAGCLAACWFGCIDRAFVRGYFGDAGLPGVSGAEGHPVPMDVYCVRDVYHHLRGHAPDGSVDDVAAAVLAIGEPQTDHSGGFGGDSERAAVDPAEDIRAD